ncbi:MAG TPA: DUF559 domain-containing protein [Ignavibacteria bacterium]|nr:DUF559 domain-containing protein [Ignavibacteria bacterium]
MLKSINYIQRKFNYYNKENKTFAKQLRKNSTLSEIILWTNVLKAKRLKGYAFRRQRPIDKYVVDFFCKELKLIIELDGETHMYKEEQDKSRENKIKNLGFSIIRFKDKEIYEELEKVKMKLENWIENYEKKFLKKIIFMFPPPAPLREGE